MKPNIVFLDSTHSEAPTRPAPAGEYKGYAARRRKSFPTAAAKPT
ncbi:MAG: hypothetical protein ACLRMJ_06760 [Alistipes finegoldii]